MHGETWYEALNAKKLFSDHTHLQNPKQNTCCFGICQRINTFEYHIISIT